MLKKLAVISLTAGALVLAAPAVASAAPSSVAHIETDSYAETPHVSVGDPIIESCEVSTVMFGAGYFASGSHVSVSVSGVKAADAVISGSTAAGDGSLVLTFRPPSDGSGNYAITFSGPAGTPPAANRMATAAAASTRTYTATITVANGKDATSTCDHDPGVAPAGTELPLTGGGFELALTGGDVSPWVIGGGALALTAGGVLVAVGAARRKRA